MSIKDHLSVRLKEEEIARVDAVKASLSSDWHPATRSDALRALILAGLEVYEQRKQNPADTPTDPRRPARRRRRAQ
jgi:hypothetical protein